MEGYLADCDRAELPVWEDPAPFTAQVEQHSFAFYPAGQDRREALLAMIDNAQRSLKVAFYIFSRDGVGETVRDAMVAAARRGVDVTVIVDGFGAEADDDFFRDMTEAGGTFHVFMARWSRRALIRNHQKIVIADDTIAMLGGFNVADDYFAPPRDNGWNDLGFRMEGPAVAQVAKWFAELSAWVDDEKAQFRDIRRRVEAWESGEGLVDVLIGGPTMSLSSWAAAICKDLDNGEQLDMMMAYFSPGKRLRRRVERVARKGRTNLIMAGKSDNGATIAASRSLYRELLRAGANIYEFQPCKMHTKLLVLDDAVYVGSANFDMRSLYLNLEIVLRIEDRALADRMRDLLQNHRQASCRVTPKAHAREATLWNRCKWRAAWLLVCLLDYTVTRRLNLGF